MFTLCIHATPMRQQPPDPDTVLAKPTGLVLLTTHKSREHYANFKVPIRAKCWWCWQNFCRLVLIKVWFQLAVVLSAVGWWMLRRDSPSTLAAVAIILALSSWMMSRERIRRSLAGDNAQSGLGGRVDDDWSTFERPLLCLDEINLKHKAQEKKDRTACRIGIVCTFLAGVVAVVGFRN
jgi:hypothetical protein